jgi:broad specificity phosphatase PhoE
MTTFYICRHGQTENNKNERLSGWIDTPLTEEGIKNAESSATKLNGIQFDQIISSDMGRAFTTAYIISRRLGYSSEIKRSRELREVNYGDLANMPFTAYPKLSAQENGTYVMPNGESLAQMQTRVLAYVESLSRNNPAQTILLTGHDGTINAINASFTKQDIGIVDLTHNPHDFVAKFTYDDGRVMSFDEVAA